MKRIPSGLTLQEELSSLLREGTEGHPFDGVFRLSAGLMLQVALPEGTPLLY